jgi:hypothetical protein
MQYGFAKDTELDDAYVVVQRSFGPVPKRESRELQFHTLTTIGYRITHLGSRS